MNFLRIMLQFSLPSSAVRCAQEALLLHKQSPLAGVKGVYAAGVMLDGKVSEKDIAGMARFFAANTKLVEVERQRLLTERDSPTLRSFALHGGESGKQWALREHRRMLREGSPTADRVVELFALAPEAVYPRFFAGAWRYSYGMTPRSAAKFVEEYTRATGNMLDLHHAFGGSAAAVGRALWIRQHGEDPFAEAKRRLRI